MREHRSALEDHHVRDREISTRGRPSSRASECMLGSLRHRFVTTSDVRRWQRIAPVCHEHLHSHCCSRTRNSGTLRSRSMPPMSTPESFYRHAWEECSLYPYHDQERAVAFGRERLRLLDHIQIQMPSSECHRRRYRFRVTLSRRRYQCRCAYEIHEWSNLSELSTTILLILS